MLDDPVPGLRRQLMSEIVAIADELNFFVAAHALRLDAPRLSELRKGRIDLFSMEKLIRILATADRRVDVTVTNVGPRDLRLIGLPPRQRRRRRRRRGP